MTTQEQQAITDLVMRQIAIRRGSSTRRDFEVVCLVLDVIADMKCDELAKPEVGPMQDAESLSGVQALGSSGLATVEREMQHPPRTDCRAEGWHSCIPILRTIREDQYPSDEQMRAIEANTDLVAELLEALKAVVKSGHPSAVDHPTMYQAWELAGKAIARAEGR